MGNSLNNDITNNMDYKKFEHFLNLYTWMVRKRKEEIRNESNINNNNNNNNDNDNDNSSDNESIDEDEDEEEVELDYFTLHLKFLPTKRNRLQRRGKVVFNDFSSSPSTFDLEEIHPHFENKLDRKILKVQNFSRLLSIKMEVEKEEKEKEEDHSRAKRVNEKKEKEEKEEEEEEEEEEETKKDIEFTPFGQKEELTTRIRNILHEYPNDVTILHEML